MNRYSAVGILADVCGGRRVLVLSGTQSLAHRAFVEVSACAPDHVQVRRANGQEEIRDEGCAGWVRFRSVGSIVGLRGCCADVVFFDDLDPGPDLVRSILPNIMGSPVGEVIRS